MKQVLFLKLLRLILKYIACKRKDKNIGSFTQVFLLKFTFFSENITGLSSLFGKHAPISEINFLMHCVDGFGSLKLILNLQNRFGFPEGLFNIKNFLVVTKVLVS